MLKFFEKRVRSLEQAEASGEKRDQEGSGKSGKELSRKYFSDNSTSVIERKESVKRISISEFCPSCKAIHHIATCTVIVILWMFFEYAFTADKVKMYRNFKVHPNDVDFQRIVWRESPSVDIRDVRATTVIYGNITASFLALRCIEELAMRGKESLLLAAEVLLNQTYVDDVYAGTKSLQEASFVRNSILILCVPLTSS